jgi:hypothetical protein
VSRDGLRQNGFYPTSFALAAGLATLILLAAGCGGSRSPVVASLGTTGTTEAGGGSKASSFASFAVCLKAPGVTTDTGRGGHGLLIHSGADSSTLQLAVAACQKLAPSGGPPPLTPAHQAERTKGLAKFAACMRKNGVPGFPDPDGQGEFPASVDRIDSKSLVFLAADKTCASLYPTLGPKGGF